VLTSTTNKKNT